MIGGVDHHESLAERCPRRHAELPVDPRQVRFDCPRADEQRRSDLLVGLALRREVRDAALGFRQLTRRFNAPADAVELRRGADDPRFRRQACEDLGRLLEDGARLALLP